MYSTWDTLEANTKITTSTICDSQTAGKSIIQKLYDTVLEKLHLYVFSSKKMMLI